MEVLDSKYYLVFKELMNKDVLALYTKIPFNFNYDQIDFDKREKYLDKIQDDFDYDFRRVVLSVKQVHEDYICKITEDNYEDDHTGYDGFITDIKGVGLEIRSADCQSIFLYDPVKKVIGNIHSGWKGTTKRIIVQAVEMMIEEYGCNKDDIKVFFNPSILGCCFEVDKDVLDTFEKEFKNTEDFVRTGDIKNGKQKYFIDTVAINKKLLIDLGVDEDNIYTCDICTKCHSDEYHSYRAKGAKAGRNISLICLK